MFMDSLSEFDNARESAQTVVNEYKACEQSDYPLR